MAHRLSNGKWGLNRGEPQWLAWCEWWLGAFQRKFWPEKSQQTAMLTEWPPETQAAADLVAAFWAGVKDTGKRAGEEIPWDVPDHPQPWRCWSLEEERRKIMEFRDNENLAGGMGPPDVKRIDEIMQIFKAPPRQKPPRPKVEAPPLRIFANPAPVRDYDLAKLAAEKANR